MALRRNVRNSHLARSFCLCLGCGRLGPGWPADILQFGKRHGDVRDGNDATLLPFVIFVFSVATNLVVSFTVYVAWNANDLSDASGSCHRETL